MASFRTEMANKIVCQKQATSALLLLYPLLTSDNNSGIVITAIYKVTRPPQAALGCSAPVPFSFPIQPGPWLPSESLEPTAVQLGH